MKQLTLLVIAALSFSGCVVMTRRNFYLVQYENRVLGRMEGLGTCSDILRHAEERSEKFGVSGMEELAEESAKETDKKFHFRFEDIEK